MSDAALRSRVIPDTSLKAKTKLAPLGATLVGWSGSAKRHAASLIERMVPHRQRIKQHSCNFIHVSKAKGYTLSKDNSWDDVPVIEAGIGETFKFETIGQVVIGTYLGTGTLDTDDGEAEYFRFKQEDGSIIAISAAYDLRRKLTEGDTPVTEGALVRMEYLKDQETARGQTPMKVFKVQARF